MQSLQSWFDRHGDEQPQLINMYGITETTVHVTYRPIKASDLGGAAPSIIGCTIPDLQIYVMDENLEPVPIGVPGEMYVAGAGLGRGYLNRADLTAQRFIPNPFSRQPGGRLYKTGDLARYLPDGDIEYLGRCDHQVKIRGFRIELGEIEAALAAHPDVSEALVMVRSDVAEDKSLIAYVVAPPGRNLTVSDLRGYLKERLPEYMLPVAFVKLDEFPLTANGKLNRRALPAPGFDRPDLDEDYVAPQSLVEELLASIWSDVLDITRVGIHDNFFALGGDSIRSVRVVALARQRGLDLSLQQLFQHQSISELAAEINFTNGSNAEAERTQAFELVTAADRSKLPEDVEDAYPLAMLQAGMLFHMAFTPDSPLYHNVDSYHLKAQFDLEAFRQAVQMVVARHAMLRTSFDLATYTEPLQMVHKTAFLKVEADDLRRLSFDEQERIIDEFVEAEKKNRFDFSSPPLLRFHFHRRSDDTFQFTLTECHAIFDGWSLTSTVAEIFKYYFALLDDGVCQPAPPPESSYRDFVRLERKAIESKQCRQYWNEKLADSTPLKLPVWPASFRGEARARVQRSLVPVPAEVIEGLRRLARSATVPLKSVLMAAHLKVMSVMGGQTDVVTGLTCNGRPEHLDAEQVRGLFLNTVPIRLKVSRGNWLDLVRSAFEAEWESLPFRRYPLAAMQRSKGAESLFDASFNYVHFHSVEDLYTSGKLQRLSSKTSEATNYALYTTFNLSPLSSQLTVILDWDAGRLCEEQINQIGDCYKNALALMAADPAGLHHTQSLLSEDQRQRILIGWNDTKKERAKQSSINEMFEAQVARTPDATAVVCGRERLSYTELNAKANRLAHHLREMGIGPEQVVGLLIERGFEMVVGLLGILKSGAAYVPLDPTYPAIRLTYMMEDSRAAALVSQKSLAGVFPQTSARVVLLDEHSQQIAGHSEKNLESLTVPENLAYLVYTSGSTGKPKGVAITHRSATVFLNWAAKTFPEKLLSGVLASTSICFDLSVFEIFAPLGCGGKIYVADNALQLATMPLADEIGLINIVPSAIAELLRAEAVPASVKTVNMGGEALTKALSDQIYQQETILDVFDLYGPSEDTVYSTYARREKDGPATIGRPIDNTETYILSENLEVLPIAVAGELHLGGEGLARGYYGRADATAEKFVPDPFSGRAGARLYKTGDLARYMPDGSIEYLGRLDHQVKLRGYRIELGELETTVTAHEAVRIAVATIRQDDRGDKRLICYVVLEHEISMQELRAHTREKLPEYMVPSVFVALEALPLTPNGKVDRKALPAPEPVHQATENVYLEPSTDLERALVEIWKELLQLEKVNVSDNFFDIGGHSLLMLQMHGKLNDTLGQSLTMIELFQYPTISSLAQYLSQSESHEQSFEQSQNRAEMRKGSAKRQRGLRQQGRAARNPQGGGHE